MPISSPPFPQYYLLGRHIQLHAESSAEDGEQHGSVAAEDRATR